MKLRIANGEWINGWEIVNVGPECERSHIDNLFAIRSGMRKVIREQGDLSQ